MNGGRHNTQLCSNRPVTEAGLPAEGTAGLHERLVVPARWWCPHRAKSAIGFGAGGTISFAMCSAPGASGEAASSQDVLPFPCAGAGVSARIGSIE